MDLASILPIDIDNGSTDNVGIESYSISDTSFSCDDFGSIQYVVLSVMDISGNVGTDTAEVMVLDSIAPSISCFSSIDLATDQGASFATVDFSSLYTSTVTDNCTSTTLSYSLAGNSLPSSYSLPIGTHTVQVTVSDSAGNTDNCSITINVVSWTQTVSQIGQDIDGDVTFDIFGSAVSLSSDGSRMAIGATGNDVNGSQSGLVRLFEFSGNQWVQLGQDIHGDNTNDNFGTGVSLSSDGNRVAIVAQGTSFNNTDTGYTRVFELVGNVWTQLGLDFKAEAPKDYPNAVSLSSDGSILAIGAPSNDGNGSNSGHVRVFEWSGGRMVPKGFRHRWRSC